MNLIIVLAVLIANVTSEFQLVNYRAVVLLEVTEPAGQNAEEAVRRRVPKSERAVTVNAIQNTTLIEVAASDGSAHGAAARVNRLVGDIKKAMENEGNERMIIRERAEANTAIRVRSGKSAPKDPKKPLA